MIRVTGRVTNDAQCDKQLCFPSRLVVRMRQITQQRRENHARTQSACKYIYTQICMYICKHTFKRTYIYTYSHTCKSITATLFLQKHLAATTLFAASSTSATRGSNVGKQCPGSVKECHTFSLYKLNEKSFLEILVWGSRKSKGRCPLGGPILWRLLVHFSLCGRP